MTPDPTRGPRRSERSDRLDAALDELRREIHDHPVPELAAGVMARIADAPAEATHPVRGALRRVLTWLWDPRLLRLEVRPAYGFAFAAALLAGVVLIPQRSVPGAPIDRVAVAPEPAPQVYVQFRLEAPGARRVELAGTFTGWEPALELKEVRPGVWSATVPVEPGVHDYNFLVDGARWVVDPDAPQVDDAFGGRNNRLPVPAPATHA